MKPSLISRLAILAVASQTAHAAGTTSTWTNLAGGSWGTPGNWSATPSFAIDDVLDFSTLNITANATTTLDGARTAGQLTFADATTASHDWIVNTGSGGNLTLATTTGTPVVSVTNRTATINAVIAGTQGFQKTGSGTLSLAGTNTYTGITTVSSGATTAGGTVNVSGNQSAANGGWAINGISTVNFQSGSTIMLGAGKVIDFANGGGQNHRILNVAGTVTTGTSGDLWVEGGNTINLNSGANWTQNGGVFRIQPNTTYTNTTVTVNTGAAFTYAGSSVIILANSPGTNGGNASLNLSGGTFTTGKNFDNLSTGTAGTASLNFSGGGTLKLSANITSLVTTTGTNTVNVTTGTGGGVIDTNGFSTALNLPVSGAGGLTKAGTGTLTLAGTTTYTGATTVNAGTLSVSATDQFSDSAALALTTGATLDLNYAGAVGTADTVGNLRIDGTTQATGVWGRVGSIAALGATYESGLITGDGLINNTNSSAEFYWDGTGTAWSSAASWTYVAADASMNPAAAPDATKLAFFGADGLATDQTIQLGGNQALAGMTFTSPVAFNFTGGGTDSTLAIGASGINLGTTSSNVTFGSATTGQQVGLTLGAAQTWTNASTSALTTVNGVSLGANLLTTAGAGNFDLRGAVTGTGGLRKMGSGSLMLDGTNTFTGDKTIDRGSVNVFGNQTGSTGSWILRGYGDSGTTYNTVATTVTFDNSATATIASGKTVQLGNATANGGFQAQTLNANGTVTNNGTLFSGRGGSFNVGGAWTQNSAASVVTQGGGLAAMSVLSGGSFTYSSGTQFTLTNSSADANLTIDGGLLTTGVKFHNGNSFVGTSFAKLNLSNGGTLKLSANVADLFTTAGSPNKVVVGTGGGIVDTNGSSTTLNVAISGTGGLTKSGAGALTTTGTNSYTGDTTVTGGTLSVAGANLADEAAVTIASSAVINLDFAGTDTIGALTINNTALPDGVYSNATHPTYITGSGTLTVVEPSTGFAGWADDLGLSGDPDADFDKDGLADGVEYVLGTDPKAASSAGITGEKSGSNLIFTFDRDDASMTPDITLTVEAGDSLAAWPQVFNIGATTGASSLGVEITDNGATDTVEVTIPTGGAAKLFARLKVEVAD